MHPTQHLQNIRSAMAHYAKQADAQPSKRNHFMRLWQQEVDKLHQTLIYK